MGDNLGLNGLSTGCKVYIPPRFRDSHFFGRGSAECAAAAVRFPAFVLEDPQFMNRTLPMAGTCPAGTVRVYPVFDNRADANHRYAVDAVIRAEMAALGWVAGVAGPDRVVICAPQ